MILFKETRNKSPLRSDWDTPRAGEKNRRGAEKPREFFSVCGAPIPALAAEKPGGFFSRHHFGEGGAVPRAVPARKRSGRVFADTFLPVRSLFVRKPFPILTSSQPQLRFHAPQGFFHRALAVWQREGFAAGEPFADFVFRREDRAMALAAEIAADFGVGAAGVFAGQPHGEHAGVADGGGFAAGLHLLGFQAEQASDRAGDFR